jgi:hypothetical protein
LHRQAARLILDPTWQVVQHCNAYIRQKIFGKFSCAIGKLLASCFNFPLRTGELGPLVILMPTPWGAGRARSFDAIGRTSRQFPSLNFRRMEYPLLFCPGVSLVMAHDPCAASPDVVQHSLGYFQPDAEPLQPGRHRSRRD